MSSVVNDKLSSEHTKSLNHVHTHIGPNEIYGLSEEHRQYLLQRHGTLELDPVPDASDADPYNWTTSKVRTNTLRLRCDILTFVNRNVSILLSFPSMP